MIVTFDDDIVAARVARLQAALADAPFDAFVAVSGANVLQATGYRSVAAELHAGHPLRAVVTADRVVLVCPAADGGPALHGGIAPDDVVPYGRFYFTSFDGHPAADLADRHPDVDAALVEALRRAGVGAGPVGLDLGPGGPGLAAVVAGALPGAVTVDGTAWALDVRARKLPQEVDRLRAAAQLTEQGIDAALDVAGEGSTEREIAAIVAGTIVAGGGQPKFVVVTTGDRSALADAHASDRPWAPGELLRFDIGCTLDGYWSDMARTAVLGEPTALQQRRYDALLAGEQAELDQIRPGMAANAVFDLAMAVVVEHGLEPYRRQHCGHGIGTDVYEPPIINPAHDTLIEAGMTFCLETPYYEMGWGGMMVEDTIVVTEDGHERFTVSDRSLRVV